MFVLPAIDILHGKVVRLFQGDYEKATAYSDDPSKIAQAFAEQGYPCLHIIDLAGAKTGSPQAVKEIKAILALGLEIQVGGGIRSLQSAQEYLSLGVKRIIIGTQALIEPAFIDVLVQTFHTDAVVVSLDVRQGKLAVNGWTEDHSFSIETHLNRLKIQRIRHIIITDITRDGTLSGVNSSIYQPLIKAFPEISFYAAGGVSSTGDIEELKNIGAAGVIIGKAFYEKNMRLGHVR